MIMIYDIMDLKNYIKCPFMYFWNILSITLRLQIGLKLSMLSNGLSGLWFGEILVVLSMFGYIKLIMIAVSKWVRGEEIRWVNFFMILIDVMS